LSYPIIDIEGIGPAFAEKLKTAGLTTTGALLEAAKDPKGRKALAEKTGIDESRILKWANMADLMRIKGVAEEYSELLEAAGVDTVKELKTRRADNLHAKMAELNEAKKLVRQLPSEKQVADWIEQAKTLPAVLSY
jgi:predicted flap endonuclease-1-like 5' DNA nuclease